MRRERERELVINFEISKILACRVEKKKVEDFFYRGDKRLPRQAANPPSPPDFVCTHERHTHTHIHVLLSLGLSRLVLEKTYARAPQVLL